jgi:hypothetical protein
MEAFDEIRSLALSLKSCPDAHTRLVDAVVLMSEVNDLYLEISVRKDEVLSRLRQTAESARTEQLICEEWIHNCELKADRNLAIDLERVSDRDLKFIPFEDYSEDQKPSPRDLERMSPEELLQFRMQHDLGELPRIQQRYEEVCARRDELKERLLAARQKYGAILPKMQRMYDEVLGFLRK